MDPLTSPTNELSQVVVVGIGNGDRVTIMAESGTFEATGEYSLLNPARVRITLLPNTEHHLTVSARVKVIHGPRGCVYGGYIQLTTIDRFGAPLTIVQAGGPTPTPSPTATPGPPGRCIGDCGRDGAVTVNELLTMVNVALGELPIVSCLVGDSSGDEKITVDEILVAVSLALIGCPGAHVCGGIAGIPCPSAAFCELPAGMCTAADLQGRCVPIGDACPQVEDPVCGCDQMTYSNDCVRQQALVSKDHDGPC